MIDETYRQISSRESGQQYAQYLKGRKQEIEQLKQEEFEESLRQSAEREVKSNSALFGASRNIFDQQLTKDIFTKDLLLIQKFQFIIYHVCLKRGKILIIFLKKN